MENNKKVTSYQNNAMSIFVYKSSRKNAQCELFSVNHLITQNNDRKLCDNSILNQFIGTIEKIVYLSKNNYNGHLELSVNMDLGKNSNYINANNDIYNCNEYLRLRFDRKQFSSIEECINFVYMLYGLIYPYNTLNLSNTVYNNPSIKYFINMFYH